MRIFYLFEIQDKVLKNYKNNYNDLYKMFEGIYSLKKEDVSVAFNIYNSLIKPINKNEYNDYVKNNNMNNECYICYNYTHTINDLMFDEVSKMIINNSYIKIKSNKSIPSFFYNIKRRKNIFVCDFDNQDYFLLYETLYNSCK